MPYKDPIAQREYQRQWMARERAAWFDGKFCVDCGTAEGLELDHRDPKLKVTHRIWSWARERRLKELAKCVARCQSCHRRKTVENREHARGERIGSSKLTPVLVVEIRRRAAEGEAKRALAREFGMSDWAVRSLVARRTWDHV